MKKSLILALVLGLVWVLPAGAQETEPTPIPEAVNIEDPAGDANYLNGQESVDDGDHGTPADIGSISDILKVWFTHDADVVRMHFLTEAMPSADSSSSYVYRVVTDPGAGEHCFRFQIFTEGPNNPAGAFGNIRDLCGDADETFDEGVTVTFEETAEGQGLSTVTVPRTLHAYLADNVVLAAPYAVSRNYWQPANGTTAPAIDDTRDGTDYTITPAPEETEPPVKKGCTKGSPKAKKKGCKKPRP